MADLELEVFRAGDYGEKGRFGIEDLDALAADYNPERHEAPVTLDHAQSGPAFGWVKSLKRKGDRLLAALKDLPDTFLDWLRSGAWRKRSIELYRAFSDTNRPYLRAVTFLGACPPEVKGLADPVFHDGGEVIHLPGPPDADAPDGGESAALLEEREALHRELNQLREEKRRMELSAFCETLKRKGRILPAWERKGLVDFLAALSGGSATRFGEDETERPPLEWFLEFLESLPPLVFFGETPDLARKAEPARDEPLTPGGAPVSPESLDNHRRALSYREQHPEVSYSEALAHTSR